MNTVHEFARINECLRSIREFVVVFVDGGQKGHVIVAVYNMTTRYSMQHTFRTKTLVTKGGKLSIKGLPFRAGESVEVTVRRGKKSTRAAKYPLRGKPVVYRDPFKPASSDWEAMR